MAAEHGDRSVEANAPADEELAFVPAQDRGDSAERQPAATVAVEVPDGDVEDGVIGLADEGAEIEEVEDLGTIEPPAGAPARPR